jgi:hypothetical protein
MPQSSRRPAVGRAMGPALAAALAGACGSHPPTPTPLPTITPASATRAECLIASDTSGENGVIRVIARTAGDSAMVRRQWAVPPIRLDCTGEPSPGSAEAWSPDSSGLRWTLVLSESAPDAGEVVSEWRGDSAASAALARAGVRWLIPLDLRRIVLELDRPSADAPAVLADRALTVPIDSAGPALALAPPTADPRDALERGAALLRTSDPDLLAYARGKSNLRIVPLPWSWSYALVLPPGGSLTVDSASDSASFRAGLARDVVPGDARPPEPPFWWQSPLPCGTAPAAALVPPRHGPLLYPESDSIAAALAARLVALSDEAGLTVRGVPAATIDSALARDARGAVLPLPKRTFEPCRELGRWPPGSRIVPLIESRASAVVRRGVPALVVEYDGTLRPAQVP